MRVLRMSMVSVKRYTPLFGTLNPKLQLSTYIFAAPKLNFVHDDCLVIKFLFIY